MKFLRRLQLTAAFSACCLWLLPTAALAQTPAQPTAQPTVRPLVIDTELATDGALYGKVVDAAGVGIPNATVSLRQHALVVGETTSMEGGLFRVASLRGGTYSATVGDQTTTLRCWKRNTAPPTAVNEVLLVGNNIARAQGCTIDSCTTSGCSGIAGCGCSSCCGGGGIMAFLTNPWVIAAGIGAAIAIPLALDDDDAS